LFLNVSTSFLAIFGNRATRFRRLRASSRYYHRATGQSQLPGRTQDRKNLGQRYLTSTKSTDSHHDLDFGALLPPSSLIAIAATAG
jgi:hypothetical protein